MRPVIGITCNYTYDGSGPFAEGIGAREQEWQLLADDYVAAVTAAGGLPLLIPVFQDPAMALETLEHVDGLILSGGNDLDPGTFGQFPKKELGGVIPGRDHMELALARHVMEHSSMPLLGICRGIQVLNVAMGGTVHQHLPAAGYENHSLSMFRRGEISHTVRIQPESRLGALLGTELGVNSFHHQAVDRVAEGFVPVASAPDGVIEAIEPAKGERFVLGVQWHPEMMALQRPEQLALLKAFTAACTR